jgi:hypothetical protein
MQLPDRPATAPAGQPAPDPAREQAQRFLAEIEDAMRATPHHDTSPVAQPGRPPMSQKAVDASTMMLSGGAATFLVGGTASLVMVASGHADPTVCAIVMGAPAVLVLALSRFLKHAKAAVEAAPPVIQQTYTGPVTQDSRTVHTDTRGLWAKTTTKEN